MAIISITCAKLTTWKKISFWCWPWNRLMMREKPSQKFKLSQANIIIDKLKGLFPRREGNPSARVILARVSL